VCACNTCRGVAELGELPQKNLDLLVRIRAEEVLAAGVLAVGERADLEGEGEVDGLFEVVLGLLLLEVFLIQRLDAQDFREGDDVQHHVLVHCCERDNVARERNPARSPNSVTKAIQSVAVIVADIILVHSAPRYQSNLNQRNKDHMV
jgi:hypothetical protein